MNNADIGWATYPEDNAKKKSTESVSTNGPGQTKKAWMDYIKERGDDFKKIEENVFINTCVLMAIKQFVFD